MKNVDQHFCWIFAHRGASRDAAENTRSAFEKALAYPIDGIETDVQLSLDGIPVLWHDDDLARIGLPGKHIEDFTYGQLQAFPLTGLHPDSVSDCLLSLEDFLRDFHGRCRSLLELKHYPAESLRGSRNLVRGCLQLADRYGRSRPGTGLYISSFDLASLVYAHDCSAAWPYIYNFEAVPTTEEVCKRFAQHPFLAGICLPIQALQQTIAEAVHRCGKLLAVYTCNSAGDIVKALERKVDILISDEPEKALHFRNASVPNGLK